MGQVMDVNVLLKNTISAAQVVSAGIYSSLNTQYVESAARGFSIQTMETKVIVWWHHEIALDHGFVYVIVLQ